MEPILATIFTEQGIIYGLFVMIIGGFIWKGIPFTVSQFTKLREDFLSALKSQQDIFEKTLRTISDDFVKRVAKSEAWHEKHQIEIDEIKNILTKK